MLLDEQIKHYINQQREIKHQEEVIQKLRSFNREKSIKRAESREKMLEKIEPLEKPVTEIREMSIRFTPSIESAMQVLKVEHLRKAFGENLLFDDISFDVKRGEKVAIIGSNGTGKTTMLKIINGLMAPDEGEVVPGVKVNIAYYDQEHQDLSPEKTIFEEIQDEYPYMDNTAVRNALAAFLFTNDDVFKQIKDISGGERGRVSLCKLMLSKANFLILDEPTNHLDMMSKEILEKAINSYDGTVLYVSHDRYFINRTATRVLDLVGGHMINYAGNYDFYLAEKDKMEKLYLSGEGYGMTKKDIITAAGTHTESKGLANDIYGGTAKNTGTVTENKLDWQQQKEEQARIRKKEKDLQRTEKEIEELEEKMARIDEQMMDESIYTDHVKLNELANEKKAAEERLAELMELWEQLAD